MSRKSYWDEEYARYWQERVAEADQAEGDESRLIEEDSKTVDTESIYKFLDLLPITKGDRALDLACGFGRAFPYLKKRAAKTYAVDISLPMLELIPAEFQRDKNFKILQCQSENLPFNTQIFDHVITIGAFDAFRQHRALEEMIRVTNEGGYILLTGKNMNYHLDDEPALIAEEKARAKGHPNFFTDYEMLIEHLSRSGEVRKEYFFEYRKNFGEFKYTESRPDKFYIYSILFRKTKAEKIKIDKPIASDYSSTWEKYNE